MKKFTKIVLDAENEAVAVEKYLRGELSTRECAKILGCSHEYIRIFCGKILMQGIQEGWIKADFSKLL